MSRFRKKSLSDFFGRALAQFRHKVIGSEVLAEVRVDLYSKTSQGRYAGVTIEQITDSNLNRVTSTYPGKTTFCRERLKRDGLDGWLLLNNDEVIGYIWIARKSFFENYMNMEVELKDDEIYGFDFLVSKDRRSGFLANHAAWAVMRHYYEAGYKTLFSYINVENKKAVAFHSYLGSRDTLEGVKIIRLFRKPVLTRKITRNTPVIARPRQRKHPNQTATQVP
ncbi:GNAT family N-acetyltransferase [Rhodospira trueperi]|uniref:N-acetyltransferase domain-containing protein n=1 Tax=Rhodospira trueperi TaxID=69960 RepID=A0A1G7BXT3_9PROT|nr:GNAT family N-acetyltransferase [Rhodospira trueperi]SDE31908.1 hypothetical protein SAMN05421720_105221 [Rhodospira trueperi]